jgi:hypothetical protein
LVSFGFASAAPLALDFGVNRIHFTEKRQSKFGFGINK